MTNLVVQLQVMLTFYHQIRGWKAFGFSKALFEVYMIAKIEFIMFQPPITLLILKLLKSLCAWADNIRLHTLVGSLSASFQAMWANLERPNKSRRGPGVVVCQLAARHLETNSPSVLTRCQIYFGESLGLSFGSPNASIKCHDMDNPLNDAIFESLRKRNAAVVSKRYNTQYVPISGNIHFI